MPYQALVVSVHDVHPGTLTECRTILAHLDALGIHRRSLLVIPCADGSLEPAPEFGEWLQAQQAAGDEVVQHGYYHRRQPTDPPLTTLAAVLDTLLARGAGEFLSIGYTEALHRLKLGRERLVEWGCEAQGFVAPAWLYSALAARAVADAGFSYYTTHLRLRDLKQCRDHWSFGISNRPGELWPDLVGRGVNEVLCQLHQWFGPLIRIAIHPADVHHHFPFGHTLTLLRRVLAAGATPVTYADYLFAHERGA